MLTARQLEILRKMNAADEAADFDNSEITTEGLQCWLGHKQISWRSVNALIDHVLVSCQTAHTDAYRIWAINGFGKLVCRKPELADEIWLRVHRGQRFTFANDVIVDL